MPRLLAGALAVPLGVGAELAAGVFETPLGPVDLLVGLAFVWCGLSVRDQRTAGLMVGCGLTWFAGDYATALLFLHRGPLVHLLVGYPSGRPRGWSARVVVVAGYVTAVVYPLGRNDWVSAGLGVALVSTVLVAQARSTTAERRARFAGVVGATVVGTMLVLGASVRLVGADVDELVLWVYELAMIFVAAVVFVDSRWGPWRRAAVTGLALDLGDMAQGGALQTRLAVALGDPSARLAYWVPGANGYVDVAGRPVEMPAVDDPNRALTVLARDGERLGALIHDVSVAGDAALVADVVALAGTALVNARLRAAVWRGLVEVEASRRRIIAAADDERRRLERELRDGAEQRLRKADEFLVGVEHADLRELLAMVLAELDGFARGVHPRTLTESGLAAALAELTGGLGLRVELDVMANRLRPEVEAAAYFVCSEAVANTLKHAEATSVLVRVRKDGDQVRVEVVDDGVGGADPRLGSGLQGLVDRVTALGGVLQVNAATAAGTHVICRLPI
ncbi:MAG TPA: ATP-binding protein [Actinophytocola sp.]|uniref:sensor histidine kinase n=1 Tax=Actinophytocola sp. TaxID=1872138 RepID=UPI002F94A659